MSRNPPHPSPLQVCFVLYLAPDDADVAAVDGALGTVDVREALAEVVLGRLRVLQCKLAPPFGQDYEAHLDTLNLDERGVVVLVLLRSLVAEDGTLGVQTSGQITAQYVTLQSAIRNPQSPIRN